MGKSVWVVCPSCMNAHHIYGGRWTIVCECGYIIYLGPFPARLVLLEKVIGPV